MAEPSNVDATPTAEADPSTERHTIPEDLLARLLEMGFTENAVKKAIVAGCVDENTCIQWLHINADHPELNTDLEPHVRVDVVPAKRPLTEEERVQKVEELKNYIRTKKLLEAEALKQKAIDEEKKRIADGKALLLAKEAREAAQRKADYEQRQKEKADDLAAKERLRLQLAIDRYERTGLSHEAAMQKVKEDEEARQTKLAEERDHRAAADRQRHLEEEEKERRLPNGTWDLSRLIAPVAEQNTAPATPSSQLVIDFDRDHPIEPRFHVSVFDEILSRSLESGEETRREAASTAMRTMTKVLQAIRKAPSDRKLRSLKVTSHTFASKIAVMPFACLFLRQAGFQESSSSPELAAAGVSDLFTMHVAAFAKIDNALMALQSRTRSLGQG